MVDKFDQFRETMGAEVVDDFLAKFGMGPKYVPPEPEFYLCPKCGGQKCTIKERHADTDMNCMELQCPDCGYREER